MLRTVHFHGELAEKFGATHRMDVSSVGEAVRACSVQMPGLLNEMRGGAYRVVTSRKKVPTEILLSSGKFDIEVSMVNLTIGKGDIHIVPAAAGSASFLKVIIGAVLIASSFFLGPQMAVLGVSLASTAAGLGLSLALGGIAELLSPRAKTAGIGNSAKARSEMFATPINVSVQGVPVPIIIGEFRVGSVVASAGYDSSLEGDDKQTTSIQQAKIVDLIGVGPIVGPAGGNWYQATYLDDTQVETGAGVRNIEGVTIEGVLGTNTQPVLQSATAVQTEISVGAEIKKATSVSRGVSDLLADRVRFTVRMTGLRRVIDNRGNYGSSTIDLNFAVQQDGGIWIQQPFSLTRRAAGPFDIDFEMDLPLPGPWNIRVERVSNDTNETTSIGASNFSSFTIIRSHRLSYPNIAAVGSVMNPKSFGGSVPTRSWVVRGLNTIPIPTNYDAGSKTYSGEWDGTFTEGYTNNPVWALYGILTSKLYGLGKRINAAFIDKWSFYKIAQYCDEKVSDGKGGLEPRFTFNGVITDLQDAYDLVLQIANVFRGNTYWGAGTVMLTADMPVEEADVVFLNNTDVIDGVFTYSGSALKSRHSVAHVAWHNPADGYKAAIEVYEDREQIQKIGHKVKEYQLKGCTSRGQAARMAKWAVESERLSDDVANFQTSFNRQALRPGDVVAIADKNYSGTRMGGRLVAVTFGGSPAMLQSVQLDAEFDFLETDSYQIAITQTDGKNVTLNIEVATPGLSDIVTIADQFSEAPLAGSSYVIKASSLAPRQFRIITAEETEKNKFSFSALRHIPTKFARIEDNIFLDEIGFTAIATGPIEPPSSLTFLEFLFLAGQTTPTAAAILSWNKSKDPRVTRYEAEYQYIDPLTGPGEWVSGGVLDESEHQFTNIGAGMFNFRVTAISNVGRRSVPAVIQSQSVAGLMLPPEDVEDFNVQIVGDTANFSWSPSEAVNLSHYQIRFSPLINEAIPWGAAQVVVASTVNAHQPLPAASGTYLIKAVTLQGVVSENATAIVSQRGPTSSMNAVELVECKFPFFSGTKENVYVDYDNGGLALEYLGDVLSDEDFLNNPDVFYTGSGFVATGRFEFAEIVDLTDVFTSRISAIITTLEGVNIVEDIFSLPDIFDRTDLFSASPSDWDVRLEFQATEADPASEFAVWTDWTPLVALVDYTARGYKFGLVLTANKFGITPVVNKVQITVDMPDRTITGEDVAVSASGLTLDFSPAFKADPNIQITVQDGAAGDNPVVTVKNNTQIVFHVVDENGDPVARSVDYLVSGYGRVFSGQVQVIPGQLYFAQGRQSGHLVTIGAL